MNERDEEKEKFREWLRKEKNIIADNINLPEGNWLLYWKEYKEKKKETEE